MRFRAIWHKSARRALSPDAARKKAGAADMETFRSLVTLLARRAEAQGGDPAYTFVSDRGTEEAVITFAELHEAARALACHLAEVVQPGDRAILVFPPGIEFIVAFFGCLMARIIAVPMMV